MSSSSPVPIVLPATGVLVTESIHSREFRMPPSRDRFNEVFHVVRGKIELNRGHGEGHLLMPEGSYSCVPTGTEHQVVDISSSIILLLCISDQLIRRSPERQAVWKDIVSNCPWVALPQTKHETDDLHHKLRTLMGLQQMADTPRNRLAMYALVDEVLLSVHNLRTTEAGLDAGSRVRAILREIEKSIYEEWSVQRAARGSALSVRRFSELFKEITGVTFVPWLQRQRIRRACQLLASGKYTIAGAAFSSGFEDLSTFYRVFNKICGRTPRQWILDQDGHPIKPPSMPPS